MAHRTKNLLLLLVLMISSCSCSSDDTITTGPRETDPTGSANTEFYYGADLSYVNEMEDCGATYLDQAGIAADPYVIFGESGANLIRLRLWHNPTWTDYSNLPDVTKAIRRAKAAGMKVLLDFHYSDTWTDPSKQGIPAAWSDQIDNTAALSQLLYDYTRETLQSLADENLLPEIVQVGNEINAMILQEDGENLQPMNWTRNATLINSGIRAVRDIAESQDQPVEVMLHIAQPENALWWFEQANQNGITDYDWIGLSYYPLWSDYTLENVSTPMKTLIDTYQKRLMIVETAYPFTLQNADPANNILDNNALVSGFPASPQGQLGYLIKLKEEIAAAGGEGLIYWEPAWVSTECRTLWGQGSHWDNATLFDHNKQATVAMTFYNGALDD